MYDLEARFEGPGFGALMTPTADNGVVLLHDAAQYMLELYGEHKQEFLGETSEWEVQDEDCLVLSGEQAMEATVIINARQLEIEDTWMAMNDNLGIHPRMNRKLLGFFKKATEQKFDAEIEVVMSMDRLQTQYGKICALNNALQVVMFEMEQKMLEAEQKRLQA